MHILVVEDETKVARALKEGLEGERYEVAVTRTGEDGFFRANVEAFDLIILDLMLPGRDGIMVLTTLRKRGMQTPVLILTAKDTVEDRVLGLDSGADDYLVKPFAFPELLARIRALLRRGRTDQVLRLKTGDLEMDLVTRKVTRGEQTLELTAREFELLEYLLRHQNQQVSREMLAHDVWKEPTRATPLDNVIDVHIARLRKKVDQDFPLKLIHTVRGVGFILREGEP
ncbi:MAG: response regulator transcription factor [Candidatus Binatia bacterium]